MKQAPVFDEIYNNYLADVSAVDLSLLGELLDIKLDSDEVITPFYGIPHRVSGKAVMDNQGTPPIHAVSVILCQYLLLFPKEQPSVAGTDNDWVRCHNFQNASP